MTAACVVNLAQEVLNTVPLSKEQVEKGFIEEWIRNTPSVELEVSMAVREQSSSFKVTDLGAIRALIEARSIPVTSANNLAASAMGELESDVFKLFLKQAAYDPTGSSGSDAPMWSALASTSGFKIASVP